MFDGKYEEELRLLTDRPETWISLDQMIQKPLTSSGTTEFTSPGNDDGEKIQKSVDEPKEENDSEKETSVTPPPAASEEGTTTTESKD